MIRRLLAVVLLLVLNAKGGEPSSIEESNFGPESGWNRAGSGLLYTSFFQSRSSAHELSHDWSSPGAAHQFSLMVPFYSDGEHGLGDVTLSYRRQLAGGEGSRGAAAMRLSLLLPTRSTHFGGDSSGLQVSIPASVSIGDRLQLHASAGATWFRGSGAMESEIVQGVAWSATTRVALALDSIWKRSAGEEAFVFRPGVQMSFEGPRGSTVTPGIAVPFGGAGVLVFVGVERPSGR